MAGVGRGAARRRRRCRPGGGRGPRPPRAARCRAPPTAVALVEVGERQSLVGDVGVGLGGDRTDAAPRPPARRSPPRGTWRRRRRPRTHRRRIGPRSRRSCAETSHPAGPSPLSACPPPRSRFDNGCMLQRLGFPSVGEHRRFVTAIAVDTIGSGVFMPVSMLYFLVATDADPGPDRCGDLDRRRLISIPAGPVVGSIVDRIGAQRVLQVANVLQGAGLRGLPRSSTSFTGVLLATVVGQRRTDGVLGLATAPPWPSISPAGGAGAVVRLPRGAAQRRLRARRPGCAGWRSPIGTETAYDAIVVVNAAVLRAGLRAAPAAVPNTVVAARRPTTTVPHEGWRVVLRDHGYSLAGAHAGGLRDVDDGAELRHAGLRHRDRSGCPAGWPGRCSRSTR